MLPLIAYAWIKLISSPKVPLNLLEVTFELITNILDWGNTSWVNEVVEPLIVKAILFVLSKFVIRAYFKLLEGNVPAPGLVPLKLNKVIDVVWGHVNVLLSTLVTLEIEYTLSFWIVLFLTICSS